MPCNFLVVLSCLPFLYLCCSFFLECFPLHCQSEEYQCIPWYPYCWRTTVVFYSYIYCWTYTHFVIICLVPSSFDYEFPECKNHIPLIFLFQGLVWLALFKCWMDYCLFNYYSKSTKCMLSFLLFKRWGLSVQRHETTCSSLFYW